MAPVGEAWWQGAARQCLQWSLLMKQRLRGESADTVSKEASWSREVSVLDDSAENCSMNFTWRQVVADNSFVLSYLLPDQLKPSEGSCLHCLHAPSQALR